MIISSKQSFVSLARIFFSITLMFILSACMEDKDYFTHFSAAAAGAAGATAIGYILKPKRQPPKITRTVKTYEPQKTVVIPSKTVYETTEYYEK